MKNFIFLLIIIFLSSCSILNKNKMGVYFHYRVDAKDIEADIYIDNKYFGKTPKEIYIKPSKDYSVTLVSENIPYNFTIRNEFSLRFKRKTWDTNRCILDLLGSILVLPAVYLFSTSACNDFEFINYGINKHILHKQFIN